MLVTPVHLLDIQYVELSTNSTTWYNTTIKFNDGKTIQSLVSYDAFLCLVFVRPIELKTVCELHLLWYIQLV